MAETLVGEEGAVAKNKMTVNIDCSKQNITLVKYRAPGRLWSFNSCTGTLLHHLSRA